MKRCGYGRSIAIVWSLSIKMESLNGHKTIEFGFDDVDKAFGAIKP